MTLLQPSVLPSASVTTKLQANNPNGANINSYFVSRLLDDFRSGFFRLVLVPADHVDCTTLKKRVNRLQKVAENLNNTCR